MASYQYNTLILRSLRNAQGISKVLRNKLQSLNICGDRRVRGCRGGHRNRSAFTPIRHVKQSLSEQNRIPVRITSRPLVSVTPNQSDTTPRVIVPLPKSDCADKSSSFPSLLYGNVRSISRKFGDLQTTVANLKPQVCALTETWLAAWNCQLLPLCGYSDFHVTRTDSRGGGVALYISEAFETTKVSEHMDADIELLHVKLTRNIGTRSRVLTLHTLCFYRPPNGNCQNACDILCQSIDSIFASDQFANVHVCGDANRMETVEIERNYNLKQIVTFSTRENVCLDIILTNCENKYAAPTKLAPLGNSDHCMIFTAAKYKLPRETVRKAKVFDTRKPYKAKLDTFLANVDWSPVLSENNPDLVLEKITQTLQHALERNIPTRTVSMKNRDPPWLTPTLKDMQFRRDKAFA